MTLKIGRSSINHARNECNYTFNLQKRVSQFFVNGCNNIEIIKFLLENNTNDRGINQVTLYGDTALHYACKNNQLEIAKLLIDYGAKLYVTNNFREKPLDLLSDNSIKNNIKQYFAVKRTIFNLSN